MKPEFPPHPVHWYDGMLLMPYHFRSALYRSDQMLQYRMGIEQPFSWGVTVFEYNTAIFGEHIVEITKLECVMPDGTVIKHDAFASGAQSLKLDLKPYIESLRERNGYVFAAVAIGSQDELHTSFKRYLLQDAKVLSYGEKGQEQHDMMVLEPKIHLVFSDVLPSRLAGIPLIEVAWENEGIVATQFVPPTLHVDARSPIGEMSSHIAQRMREKAQFLVSKINNPQQGMSELVIDEFKFFVSCLTESLPLLEGIVATNTSHPYWMYTTLLAIAGRLSSLGSDRIPPQFKPYNHNDLFSSFDQLRKYILRMIAEGVIETFIRIPMRYEAGMYKVELKHQWRDSDMVVAAHPKLGVSSTDLNSWMQTSVIGTEGIHPSLKIRRILGVKRTEIERLPDVLVSKGTLLYSITLDEESVIFGEDLCVENTLKEHADHLPAEMSLYVKVKT